MHYVFDQLREQASAALVATGLIAPEQLALAEPKNRDLADLACPIFAAAKAAGEAPPAFSQKLAAAVRLPEAGLLAKVEAAGGFVNFTVRPEALAAAVLAEVTERGDAFGKDSSVGAGEKVIVEYSSPNIARKMHVGHLRSTVIGHSLRLIFEALGYDVIADNHLGDWGTQFGMLLAAIDLWKLTPWDDPDPVQSLVVLYAKYNSEAKEDESLKDLARAWFKKLEDGDVWARETWQKLIDITMAEFSRTYDRLGVSFTTQHGESYFESRMPAVMAEAVEKGVARRDAGGALVVEFDDKLPSCLLQKSDGGTLYQTRDAATCLYRLENYAPARNIYVVGAEQKLHFQQVFEIVRRMGYEKIADVSIHISFGKVSPPNGGRFSMREGNVVFLNDVLDEAVERAEAAMRANVAAGRSELTEEEIPEIAETLGIGAVVYADLFQGPDRNITFDWDKMLQSEGNTAMYLQYAHARCRSILRKASPLAPPSDGGGGGLLVHPAEQALLKQLARMPHAVREAGEKYLPASVADWTFQLAKAFSTFWENCPVLRDDVAPEMRTARLELVAATAQGLKNGLALLGIKAPERV
ncbi:arginine--tRNA ligase [Armatimonas rosea]|uniref:Arginine--tRNA ligase n=1 Tax=Armatimonas rosea TaxID=685828 RepID=A0A7W9SS59_ARMRO|nr:arginine--tRNA ligase [Armatimonas rosea]MBB6051726.1 arginyl-tRNA synthetase [Armatimonas rosea]